MRAAYFGLLPIFVPVALTGIIGLSCATQTVVEGTGGSGGDAVSSSSVAASSSGAGGCVVAADCTAMNDQCNTGTCVNGACVQYPSNELGACDDGQFCTVNEACMTGVCTGGTPKVCTASDVCHIAVCDEATDTCTETPGNDNGPCDDGDACTLLGSCTNGACSKGGPVDCSAVNGTCAIGACDPPIGCKPMPQNDGTPCNDNLYCTVNDVCMAGKCTGSPNPCAPPNSPCLVGMCNEVLKTCANVPVA